MTISLIIVVPGVVLLLIAAFAGLATSQARGSQERLVAPRNAGFGEAGRLMRAEATRERARADLKALTSRQPGAALVMVDTAAKPVDRHAA
ncbi:MAG TPA: hypothetical protein VLL08_16745 [Kineosporiaceae bacterium]|nr:hypothetical protein [Kineosporiaceae bacterium]